jgi:hypothetical protein
MLVLIGPSMARADCWYIVAFAAIATFLFCFAPPLGSNGGEAVSGAGVQQPMLIWGRTVSYCQCRGHASISIFG